MQGNPNSRVASARRSSVSSGGKVAGDGSGGARDREGLFDLAKNLRLAYDHGIQAGGHAEEMADGLLVAVLVEVRREDRGLDAELAREKRCNRSAVGFHNRDQLHAIAGGDDHALRDSGSSGESARGLGQFVAADGDLLAQRDGRGFMVHANERERHWGPDLLTWLKKLTAQTAIITTSAAPET